MKYLLDTNILIHLIRKDATAQGVTKRFAPLDAPNVAVISAVTLGEIESIAFQRQWGKNKQEALLNILRRTLVADINSKTIFQRYA